MEYWNALMLSNTVGWGNNVVKRVPSMYSAGVFIGNQVSGQALISTIMPLVTYLYPEYSPLGVITGHYSGVKYNLNKHTINPTPWWGLYMGSSKPAGRTMWAHFANPGRQELRSLLGALGL
jgi:hypothetical protein